MSPRGKKGRPEVGGWICSDRPSICPGRCPVLLGKTVPLRLRFPTPNCPLATPALPDFPSNSHPLTIIANGNSVRLSERDSFVISQAAIVANVKR